MDGINNIRGPNVPYLTRVKTNLFEAYQDQIQRFIVPNRRDPVTRGLLHFNHKVEIYYPELWAVLPEEYRPQEHEEPRGDDEQLPSLEDVPQFAPLSLHSGTPRSTYDPMMTTYKSSQSSLNQAFTLMTVAMAMRHHIGNELHHYPNAFYVGPGTVRDVDINQTNVAGVASRVVFSEATSDNMGYGAIVYIGRTYPRTAVMTLWLPALYSSKEHPGSSVLDEETAVQVVQRAIQRWTLISRRMVPLYTGDMKTDIPLANRSQVVRLNPSFVKYTASGTPLSVWCHLARHVIDGNASRVFLETPEASAEMERLMVEEREARHPEWLQDDLSEVTKWTVLDTSHIRWARGVMVSGVVPYWVAQTSKGPVPRFPVAAKVEDYMRK